MTAPGYQDFQADPLPVSDLMVPISLAMIAIAPCLRAAAFFVLERPDDVTMEAYPCVMDSIATGCLLAALKPRLDIRGDALELLDGEAAAV